MGKAMQRDAIPTTISSQPCSVVLPLHIWSIVFEESARDAELHLTQHVVKQPFNIHAKFFNAQKNLLSLCKTSREAMFKYLVLFIDVPNITHVRLSLPPTILESIQHVKRTFTISTNFTTLACKQLDLDWFPALRNLYVLVRYQLRRDSDPSLLLDLSEEETRMDTDYKHIVSLAGGHFTRRRKQHFNPIDYTWARYWKYPQLEDSIKIVEDQERDLSRQFEENVNITISYEVSYSLRQRLRPFGGPPVGTANYSAQAHANTSNVYSAQPTTGMPTQQPNWAQVTVANINTDPVDILQSQLRQMIATSTSLFHAARRLAQQTQAVLPERRTVTVSWKTKFPTHEITEKVVSI